MPIVKQSWVKTPEALEKYLTKDRESEAVRGASDGLAEEMASQIRAEHEQAGKNVKNLALTIIQSWPDKESDLFPPEKYNEMGLELAKRIAPGHSAWVITHTEKNHIHNHIVISSVNCDTGKLLTNKRSELVKLHEANNAIARENGFGVLEPKVKAFDARLPQNVRSMVARGKQSWFFDLAQKADFSRAASTSFDEYVGVMKGLGVHVRVEDKNISYFYGDRNKAVRGKSLGNNFGKDGLIKAFKENDERFAKLPGLRERIRSDIGSAFDGKGNPLGTPSDLLLKSASHTGVRNKDYNQYTKIRRANSRDELPPVFIERGGILHEEMTKAKKISLFEYCDQNRIRLATNEQGQSVLRGKEFVVFTSGTEWKNTKNGRTGTIVDFAATHLQTTPLRALAKLNNNPRLLILEQVMGEYRKGTKAFHMPKPQAAPHEVATQTVNRLLQSKGIRGDAAKGILQSRNVHVGKDASVWLLGEKGDTALEFREQPDGQWKAKRHGNPAGVFSEKVGKSQHLTVFRDPFEFMLFKAKGPVPGHGEGGHLVLMGDSHSHRRLDELLALNGHISQVHLATTDKPEHPGEQKQVDPMKKRFDPFSIEIKELHLTGIGKNRSRGPDISM